METTQIILMDPVCPSTRRVYKTMKRNGVGFCFSLLMMYNKKLRISQVYHYIHWEELTSVSEAHWLYFNFG